MIKKVVSKFWVDRKLRNFLKETGIFVQWFSINLLGWSRSAINCLSFWLELEILTMLYTHLFTPVVYEILVYMVKCMRSLQSAYVICNANVMRNIVSSLCKISKIDPTSSEHDKDLLTCSFKFMLPSHEKIIFCLARIV